VKRLDVIWLAAFSALVPALVVMWPTGYVDDRPMCSGVPKLTYPHRNTCYGDELPADWVLTHPSILGLMVLGAIAVVTVAWLFLRSRTAEST
jgi:hypothetical protein